MNRKNVLIVEDNELNMLMIRSLLQLGGYIVSEATDAETGLRLARQKKPDLILMDIQLPGMDGLTAARLIQQDTELKYIPIIVISSHIMQGGDQQAAEAGCKGYISKPIDTRGFLKEIEKCFT